MSALAPTRGRRLERPRPMAPADRAGDALGRAVGWTLGTLISGTAGLVRLVYELARAFPKATVVACSLAAAALWGGWPLLVLTMLLWVALTWLAISQAPEAVRAAVGWLPGTGAPVGGARRHRLHGVRPMRDETVSPAQAPDHVQLGLHRVGRDPISGLDRYVPTLDIDPDLWADDFDVTNENGRTW